MREKARRRKMGCKERGTLRLSEPTFSNFSFLIEKAEKGFRRLLTPLSNPFCRHPSTKKIRFSRVPPLVFQASENVGKITVKYQ